jgi:hypothetical protein
MKDQTLNSRKETIELYKSFVKGNKRPLKNTEKRAHFINWFINENSIHALSTCIKELSEHYLFISSKTIEDSLFNYATQS